MTRLFPPTSLNPAALAVTLIIAFTFPVATAQVLDDGTDEDEYTRSKLDAHVATMAKQVNIDGDIYSGELEEGEADYIDLKIEFSKTYLVTAACNENCSEITLTGSAPGSTKPFVTGTGDDDLPVFRVQPGQTDHLYVEIAMADCYEDPCAYVLGVYEAK